MRRLVHCVKGFPYNNDQFYASAERIYTICVDVVNRPGNWLVALDAATGNQQWVKQFSLAPILQRSPAKEYLTANPELVFVALDVSRSTQPQQVPNQAQVLAFSSKDGEERWNFPLNARYTEASLIGNDTHIFIINTAPRWSTTLSSKPIQLRHSSQQLFGESSMITLSR